MNGNDGSTRIGNKKNADSYGVVSYVMEALPTPDAWGVEPKPAIGTGHMRLIKGKISFIRLDVSLEDRMDGEPEEEEEIPTFSHAAMDPADALIGEEQKRSIHRRERNIDLFDLERRVRSSLPFGKQPSSEAASPSASGAEDGAQYIGINYRNPKDAEKIRFELGERAKQLQFNLMELGVVTIFLGLIEVLPAFGLSLPGLFLPERSPVSYLLIELVGLCFAAFLSFSDLKAGFRRLFKWQFNTRAVLAAAVLAECLHIVYMLVRVFVSHTPATNAFTAPLCMAMLIYHVNRLMNTRRVAKGFQFVTRRGQPYAVLSADDSPIAADLRYASGSSSAKIAYPVRTQYLSGYFTNACREDRCSSLTARLYPYFLIAAGISALISGIRGLLSGGDFFHSAFAALCAVMVTGVPITGLLCLEIPLSRTVSRLLRKGTLLNGWNAVDKFGDTDAFALNTTDLFPAGSIKIRKAVQVGSMDIDEVTVAAAAVVIASGGALASVFDELVGSRGVKLSSGADGIVYENELGVSGWLNEKRIFVGNRQMMETHRVIVPDGGLARLNEFEAVKKRPGHQLLYVAVEGRLVGFYLLEYKASLNTRNALVQLISDGSNVMFYTCDANITVELITKVFDIPSRYLSILDTEGSRTYDSVTYAVTNNEEALLGTDGTLRALSEGVRAAVRLKENESLGYLIQLICFGMGFLFVAGLSCISAYAIDAAQILIMQLVFVLISLISIVRSL